MQFIDIHFYATLNIYIQSVCDLYFVSSLVSFPLCHQDQRVQKNINASPIIIVHQKAKSWNFGNKLQSVEEEVKAP